jgi:hypothetical protein
MRIFVNLDPVWINNLVKHLPYQVKLFSYAILEILWEEAFMFFYEGSDIQMKLWQCKK